MTRPATFPLDSARNLGNAIAFLGRQQVGVGLYCSVGHETRTQEQNRKLHPMIRDVARHVVEWAGKRRSEGEWKTLLISGHAKATEDEQIDIVMGLEGEVVGFRESSAAMSKKRLSSLIEYIYAWGTEQGVCWSEGSITVFDEYGVECEMFRG